MMRFIMPIILIGITVAFFFMFTNPMYNDILTLNSEVASYNSTLDNSKMLENERDKLTAKYNAIDPDNLTKLQKLLPENVNNVRLILEIGQIALPYGMVLKDVKYGVKDASTDATTAGGTVVQGGSAPSPKDYGTFDLEFSTSGTYNNFINFTKDLESNLRIVDISSIMFSSDTGSIVNNPKINSPEIYKYNFKIKTYWLKN
jgi:Tfp pilus assembly protein PilO